MVEQAFGPEIQAALFDIDGTLTTGGYVWAPLIKSDNIQLRRKLWLYGTGFPHYAASKTHLVSQQKFRDRWVRLMAWMTTDWTDQQVADVSRAIVDIVLLPNLRTDMVRILRKHREKGHMVILVSTMFSTIVSEMAQEVGANAGLGSVIEFENGRSQGRIVGQTCSGARKIAAVARYLREVNSTIQLGQCAGYADSRSDIPFLAGVGLPIATYPDEQMNSAAISRQWHTITG